MQTGLDRLPALAPLVAELRASRVGLLAHPASVDRGLRHVRLVLDSLGIHPRVMFGPEHGYGGEAQDMVGVASAQDPETGAPIVSLYGETFDSLSPSTAHLALIDTLVIDLADIGSRYYTFVWTALLAVRAAAKAGVRVVLLDRPNPLGNRESEVEGQLPERHFLSFVGLEPVPVRHGLTLGEIVALFASREVSEGVLRIVATDAPERGVRGWDRPFVLPSPNMPTEATALVYPGGCLIEGTNLSEGRGTTRPFEIVGAPFLDGGAVARRLLASGLPGFVARPLTFLPMFHKHARVVCGGVQIHVTDPDAFRPYATYLALIGFAREHSGGAFRFRTERYEFVDDPPAIDLLTGGSAARVGMDRGDDPAELARALSAPTPACRALREAAREAARRISVR